MAAIVLAPWLFGAVQPAAQFWMLTLVILALVGWCIHEVSARHDRPPLPPALVPLLAALTLGTLQLVELGPSVLEWVSPRGAQFWQELDGTAPSRPTTLYSAATRHALALLVLAVVVFFLGSRLFHTPQSQLVLLGIVAVNGAAFTFFALAQQLTWNGMLYWTVPLTQGGGPFGAFVNKNNAGAFLNLSLAAAVGLAFWTAPLRREKRGVPTPAASTAANGALQRRVLEFIAELSAGRMAALCLAALLVAGVFCSLSRGAMVSLVGAALVTMIAALVTRSGGARWWMIGAGALVAWGLVAWVGMSGAVQTRLNTLQDEQLFSETRIPHWQDGLKAAPDFWRSGSGLGTYGYVYGPYQQRLDEEWYKHAENQYLEASVEGGLPGLLFVLSAIVLVGWAAWRLLRGASSSRAYALGIAGVFALASQSIHAFFDFGLYLPANAMLLALLAGAMTGRAARLAAAPEQARLVALPQWAALPGSVAALLLIAGVLSAREVHSAAVVDAAVRQAPLADDGTPASRDDLHDKANRLALALQERPDDAEAQLHLARLLIHEYRLIELERLRSDESVSDFSAARLWDLTSPVVLEAQIHYLTAQPPAAQSGGQELQLLALRGRPGVAENLQTAHSHLELARSSCPLMPRAHLGLAELSAATGHMKEEEASVERTRSLAPADPDLLYRCGLVEILAGRQESACRIWKQCLTLSERHLAAILQLAGQYIAAPADMARLLPDSPELLLRLAGKDQREAQGGNVCDAAVIAAEGLLDGDKLPEDQRRYLRASLLAIEGQNAEAIEQYRAAVKLRPGEVGWRYELAVLLKEEGRLDEAREEARICAVSDPRNEAYLNLLREIHRRRLIAESGKHEASTTGQGGASDERDAESLGKTGVVEQRAGKLGPS